MPVVFDAMPRDPRADIHVERTAADSDCFIERIARLAHASGLGSLERLHPYAGSVGVISEPTWVIMIGSAKEFLFRLASGRRHMHTLEAAAKQSVALGRRCRSLESYRWPNCARKTRGPPRRRSKAGRIRAKLWPRAWSIRHGYSMEHHVAYAQSRTGSTTQPASGSLSQ